MDDQHNQESQNGTELTEEQKLLISKIPNTMTVVSGLGKKPISRISLLPQRFKESPINTLSVNDQQTFIQALSWDIGEQQYDLKESDFIIYYREDVVYNVAIDAGPRVVIKIGTPIAHIRFKGDLLSAIGQVAAMKRGQALVTSKDAEAFRLSLNDSGIEGLAKRHGVKMVPRGSVEVTYFYKVVVKHKESGLVIEREATALKKSFLELTEQARLELAPLVGVAEYHKEGGFKARQQTFLTEEEKKVLSLSKSRKIKKMNRLGDK